MKKISYLLFTMAAAIVLAAALFKATLLPASATIQLPHILSDGMVLQRNDTVKIWGTAAPQESVTLLFLKKKYHTTADAQGRWSINLPTHKAGGPYTMTVGETTLKDIYIGDVWLTSGQSNMDLMVSRVSDLYAAETDAYSNPAIHLIQIATRSVLSGPMSDLGGTERWEALTPETSGHWSALSYFFAKEMYEKTGVPQGIINASQGGSSIETWVSRKALAERFPKYIEEVDFNLSDGYMQRCNELNAVIGQQWNRQLESSDPGLKEHWIDPATDDSDWETVQMYDRNIGQLNGRPFVGTLWFRKTFDVPADMAGRTGMLRLGCLIDADDTYLNGRKVGSTGYQYPPRRYAFDAATLRPGRNVLTIRLQTNGGAEKFVKDKPYKIIVGDREISLEGEYKMKRGALMPRKPGVAGFGDVATGLYNGMIAPLTSYRIGGIVWYQGESNTGRVAEYRPMLESLARDWRADFGEVPLIVVQLANYMQRHTTPVESSWAAMREAQRQAAESIPNAGLATAADLGEWNDIHPLRKKGIAHRVALQAERLYLHRKVEAEGPAYQSCRIDGRRMILNFRPGTASFRPAAELKGFTMAGSDRKFYTAHASVQGETIVVECQQVEHPVSVRYGWDDNPELTLYGTNGLPAAPFATDDPK